MVLWWHIKSIILRNQYTFYGKNKAEIRGIIAAHKKTDVFFAGSFKGEWNGIKLKNSKIQYE